MEKFTFENVESAQGSVVKVVGQNGEVELEVSSVTKSKLDGDEWNAFSVLLNGKTNEPLSQGTYKLENEAFGEAELFLSPNSETEYEIHIAQKR
ncbi:MULTISPECIES: DUF6916 family protein [Pseudoalteromonas]|uniref:DUF6916 domain-containing protein n=1 Tax=Pseudoalteromonas fuliginea TaxID=1872678 RepID=A0ABQ6RIC6_9GAMM|nr:MULTISPECIES: hypothetical protein [Pseudoalteromonas]KAA1156635.1 hypothetical protein EU509_09595 [Pseudoalteromonas fuliginea]KAA1167464.1 hypothetical protein EUZ79_09585 [Pseudoalteromonas fuliginea]MDQ2042386.1 hypothetical protein [Pseudoalteromonas sp. 20-92]GAA79704.1 hypothetical protein P20495_2206 [Pseudoalteromonas sp. BSi20495]